MIDFANRTAIALADHDAREQDCSHYDAAEPECAVCEGEGDIRELHGDNETITPCPACAPESDFEEHDDAY